MTDQIKQESKGFSETKNGKNIIHIKKDEFKFLILKKIKVTTETRFSWCTIKNIINVYKNKLNKLVRTQITQKYHQKETLLSISQKKHI